MSPQMFHTFHCLVLPPQELITLHVPVRCSILCSWASNKKLSPSAKAGPARKPLRLASFAIISPKITEILIHNPLPRNTADEEFHFMLVPLLKTRNFPQSQAIFGYLALLWKRERNNAVLKVFAPFSIPIHAHSFN